MISSSTPKRSSPIVTWLSTLETPSTSSAEAFPIAHTSPSVGRKRHRSQEFHSSTSQRKKSICSLDGPEGPVCAYCASGPRREERISSLGDREPLREMSEPNAGFNQANQQITPKSSEKSHDSYAAQKTPSGSSSASIPVPGLKLNKSTHNVRQTLAQHGMQIDATRLRDDYKLFEEHARSIPNGQRGSTMKQGSAEHVIRWIRQNKTRSEETIMAQLVPLIISSSRKVLKGTQKNALQMDSPSNDTYELYEVRFFSDDGALVNINRQFHRDLLPTWLQAEDQAALRKMIAKEPGMTVPKPDYTYGIHEDQYPDIYSQKFGTHIRALMGVAPEMIHPFFIIEGKTSKGDLADAENQAIRGGATLVRSRRLLNSKAEVADAVGPDLNSFVYSMTMDTNIARIWLNWCEILPRRRQNESGNKAGKSMDSGELYETYHMNPLYTALLDSEDMLKELRRRVKNIIDWGCIQRMNEIKEVMTKIFKIEQAADQARSESGSPRKKLKTTEA